MTDIEILEKTINTLNNIHVPAALVKDVGIPIYNSVMDLTSLHDAILEQIKAAQEKKQEEEPEIQISEAEVVDEIPEGAEPLKLVSEEKSK